jgi:hypothetical protein
LLFTAALLLPMLAVSRMITHAIGQESGIWNLIRFVVELQLIGRLGELNPQPTPNKRAQAWLFLAGCGFSLGQELLRYCDRNETLSLHLNNPNHQYLGYTVIAPVFQVT